MKTLPSFSKIRLQHQLYWMFQKNLKIAKVKDMIFDDNKEEILAEKDNINLLKNYYFKKHPASLG